jgi:hypothetical protein
VHAYVVGFIQFQVLRFVLPDIIRFSYVSVISNLLIENAGFMHARSNAQDKVISFWLAGFLQPAVEHNDRGTVD